MGQHDGADHRDGQDDARGFEQEQIAAIQQRADGGRVGQILRRGGCRISRAQHQRARMDSARTQQQFSHQHQSDEQTQRQVLGETGPQRGKIDVEHHHHEEEQHSDRADVDDDQQHGDELGPDQHHQTRRVEERQDQPQHRMDRVACQDGGGARDDHQRGKQIESKKLDHGAAP
jgi:hypothetical protein